jgi:hypothetical protein
VSCRHYAVRYVHVGISRYPEASSAQAASGVSHLSSFSLSVLNLVRFYRLARKELREERSNIYREIEEVTLLLRETARKHTHAEKSKEGMSRNWSLA